MALFDRYIGIDYSGAEVPNASLKGLRVYAATPQWGPVEVQPPPSPRKYWARREVAQWVVEQIAEGPRTLIGIDHGFSFPLAYFKRHRLPHDWPAFLEDFQRHWPTDQDDMYVDFIRDGLHGNGAARTGSTRWKRLTEVRAGSAKSVFHFDVQGAVAKSTHSGLPWLRFIRQQSGERVWFWPFDGWSAPADRSVVVEVYPRRWNRTFPPEDRTPDQHDAWCIAAWMKRADADCTLVSAFDPSLTPAERSEAEIEGWILGVP